MDNLSVVLFLVTSLSLLAGAIWLMSRGISAQYVDPGENYRTGEWTTQVKKVIHPEMKDVEPGEQLMGVTFQPKEVTECDIEQYRSLQARIDALKAELTDDEDDEDDDDGDIVVRV